MAVIYQLSSKLINKIKNNKTDDYLFVNCHNLHLWQVRLLTDALYMNKNITYLNIFPSNKIGAEGAELIANLLVKNSNIRELDIRGNGISTAGVTAITEALKINNSLKVLYLNSNKISKESWPKIADMLRVNKSLKQLYISKNNLDDQGVELLMSALKENESLTDLYLGTIDVSLKSLKLINNVWRESKVLKNIVIENDLLSGEIGEDFALTAETKMLKEPIVSNSNEQMDFIYNIAFIGLFILIVFFALKNKLNNKDEFNN